MPGTNEIAKEFPPDVCVIWTVASSEAQILHFMTDEPSRGCHSANFKQCIRRARMRNRKFSQIVRGHGGYTAVELSARAHSRLAPSLSEFHTLQPGALLTSHFC